VPAAQDAARPATGEVAVIPRLAPAIGANAPPCWNRWSPAGKVEHRLGMSLDRMAEILGRPADGLGTYRPAVQAQIMRVVATVGAKAAERRFDPDLEDARRRFEEAMLKTGWLPKSDDEA
jgi:hypothetical protein